MLCTEMDSWFKHSIVLNGLSYGIARLFDSFVLSRSMIEGTAVVTSLEIGSHSERSIASVLDSV